ncbi:hypothetical protein ABK040_014329 [Willaertia magna]
MPPKKKSGKGISLEEYAAQQKREKEEELQRIALEKQKALELQKQQQKEQLKQKQALQKQKKQQSSSQTANNTQNVQQQQQPNQSIQQNQQQNLPTLQESLQQTTNSKQQQLNKKDGNLKGGNENKKETVNYVPLPALPKIHFQPPKEISNILQFLTTTQEVFTKEQVQKNFNLPLLNYISTILSSQNDISTKQKEKDLVEVLKKIFIQNKIFSENQNGECQKFIEENLLKKLKEKNLLKEWQEQEQQQLQDVKLLEEAISLGKKFEKEVAEQESMISSTGMVSVNQTGTDSNWNDELDWKLKEIKKQEEKRKKKEDAIVKQKQKEYEEFLQKRGIQNQKGVIKVHTTHDFKGPREIRCNDITVSVGSKVLIEETDLNLLNGRRYGLIGRNGVGKTTLLRHIAERDFKGIPPYLQILHIEQEIIGDEFTAIETVLNTDVERIALLKEEKRLLEDNAEDSGQKLSDVYARLDEIDAHSAEARAAAILSGLQFTTDMMHMKTKDLSGGWRMRVSLARALFVEPDILLLDEPTNHLDLFAVIWLEDYLKKYDKTLVVVSHAKKFLNAVVTDIVHVTDRKLQYYRGDYDTFEKTRKEQLQQQQRTHEAQKKQREHIQSFIDRFRYKAATAKMAQSRIKVLEKMDFVAAVVEDPTFTFTFDSPEPEDPPYLQAIDVTFGYTKEKVLFKKLNFNLDMDSRIALVGSNGTGKSTFLNILSGDLRPLEGHVNLNRKIRIARFSQHHMDQLNPQHTALEHMAAVFPNEKEQTLRSHLGKLGISGDLALQSIYTLSGGQKSRVVFSELTFRRPHLLLLDEPSNHLDIDTVDALIEALNSYNGGILMVSHDEYLITSVCDELWVCSGKSIKKYNGDFYDYKKEIIAEMAERQQQL